MAREITRETNRVGSLLSSTSRVEAPFVRVVIGGYSFGVYEKNQKVTTNSGVAITTAEKFPNYIQGLNIKKINGIINQYTLRIKYPITENSDPNFFEKLFSTVSGTRKIEITYGDFMLPEYIYKDEEAIITKVTNNFNILESSIDYTIYATSTSKLTLSGCFMFPTKKTKPSDEIKRILAANEYYHLTDVFTKMKDKNVVEANNWIASDDKSIQIPTCKNISALEYISLLVSYMTPAGSGNDSAIKTNVYSLSTYDEEDGSYFKVQKIQRAANALNQLCTYDIDIGYPTANIITNFRLSDDQTWSLYYDYNKSLSSSDYLKRIDDKGNIDYYYSPQLTGSYYGMDEATSTWWTKVTQYPTKATITLKGLLKPAILMQYVKLNVWFYGRKHISSGYYIITSQEDSIGSDGYKTTLELLRVASDDDMEV